MDFSQIKIIAHKLRLKEKYLFLSKNKASMNIKKKKILKCQR